MSSKENKKNYLDATSYGPLAYGVIYLANIFTFSLVYVFIFADDFNRDPVGYVQSLYFSVVTVTTLGFGDLTPKLDEAPLLLVVTSQVIFGVITIGLFLNSISHKLSERKDHVQREIAEEVENANLKKLLTILRPTIVSYMEVLSETYKVTTTSITGGFEKLVPEKVFSQHYYDQISRQDFLSDETRYGKGVITWGDFIEQENRKFINQIDDYLNKFATSIPIDLVELLVDLKGHPFLFHCRQAKQIQQIERAQGFKIPRVSMLTIEHSSVELPEKPNSIQDFHEKLLKIINLVDEKTAGERIIMTVDLRKGVTAPPIGSAISEIIKFGPFDGQDK